VSGESRQPEQSPQSRLLGAGYAGCFGGMWLSPDGHRVLSVALAELDGDNPEAA
jgi:hypothetical protein